MSDTTLMSDYIDIIYGVMGDVFVWMRTLFASFRLDITFIIVGLVTVFALYKYVLSPYLSGSGSDKAKVHNTKKDGG